MGTFWFLRSICRIYKEWKPLPSKTLERYLYVCGSSLMGFSWGLSAPISSFWIRSTKKKDADAEESMKRETKRALKHNVLTCNVKVKQHNVHDSAIMQLQRKYFTSLLQKTEEELIWKFIFHLQCKRTKSIFTALRSSLSVRSINTKLKVI